MGPVLYPHYIYGVWSRTPSIVGRAYLACFALHVPRSVAPTDVISNLLVLVDDGFEVTTADYFLIE
jgi:hypothetical protein